MADQDTEKQRFVLTDPSGISLVDPDDETESPEEFIKRLQHSVNQQDKRQEDHSQ